MNTFIYNFYLRLEITFTGTVKHWYVTDQMFFTDGHCTIGQWLHYL